MGGGGYSFSVHYTVLMQSIAHQDSEITLGRPIVSAYWMGDETLWRTPTGACNNAHFSEGFLEGILETAFEKVLRRVLRRCLAVGFRGRKGS